LDRRDDAAAFRATFPARPRNRRRSARRSGFHRTRRRAPGVRTSRCGPGLPVASIAPREASDRAMRDRRMTGDDRQRGMVLVTVLWTIALCSALAMATAVSFRSFAGIAAINRDRVQVDALLTAGLEAAAGVAMGWPDRPLLERTAAFELSTGTVRVQINRSEERRVGKGVDLGGRGISKKKNKGEQRRGDVRRVGR